MKQWRKDLGCLIGFHRWLELNRSDTGILDRQVANEIDPLENNEYRSYSFASRMLVDRICINCKKRNNQIRSYAESRLQAMESVIEEVGLEGLIPRKHRIPDPPPPPPRKPK